MRSFNVTDQQLEGLWKRSTDSRRSRRIVEALAHDFRPYLTGRLRRRLRFLMVPGSMLLLIAAHDVIVHFLALFLALPAAAVGLGIGLMVGRISLFSWDPETRRVKAGMDAVGVASLILYTVIISSRREILGQLGRG